MKQLPNDFCYDCNANDCGHLYPPVKLKIKRLHPDAVMPKYAKPGDACFDLVLIDEGKDVMSEDPARASYYREYSTGLAFEIPPGHVGLCFPRSSSRGKALTLANCVGVIDSGYRGEVKASFRADGTATVLKGSQGLAGYKKGERGIQMMILPIPAVELIDVGDAELSTSERGTGGHGSSGQ